MNGRTVCVLVELSVKSWHQKLPLSRLKREFESLCIKSPNFFELESGVKLLKQAFSLSF